MFAIQNIINHSSIRLVHLPHIKIDIYISDAVPSMSEGGSDGLLPDVKLGRNGGPCMTAPVLADLREQRLSDLASTKTLPDIWSNVLECVTHSVELVLIIAPFLTNIEE